MSQAHGHDGQAAQDGVGREQREETAGQLVRRACQRLVDQRRIDDGAGGHVNDLNAHALDEVRECDAQQDRDEPRADRVRPVPGVTPLLGGDLATPLEGHDADNQADEDQEEGEVHAREHGRVPLGERGEGRATSGEQPHLVAVPVGADRAHGLGALTVALGDEGEEHADAEVEALEDQVDRPQNGDENEPQDRQSHDRCSSQYPKDRSAGASSSALSAFDEWMPSTA